MTQTGSLAQVRKKRSDADVKRSLAALAEAATRPPRQARLMPLIIDAARARATVGEISAQLAAAWGVYRAP
jgi:methylmalonyl-CoA mutase N-terminal domain/subunit